MPKAKEISQKLWQASAVKAKLCDLQTLLPLDRGDSLDPT